MNAVSLPDGDVGAYRGLAQLIGDNRELWAAVLSRNRACGEAPRNQENGNYVEQQIEYYRMRARYGDKNAVWTALALRVAGTLTRLRMCALYG